MEAQESVRQRVERFLTTNGTRSVDSYHRELGHIMWEYCGMERTAEGLRKAIDLIRSLRDDFWRNVKVLGEADTMNQSLERAGRVADFFELGELMCIDALNRRESCGGHFRGESQTEEGEALRHDEQYAYVAAWEWAGEDGTPVMHKEVLEYEFTEMKQRSVQVKVTLNIWRQPEASAQGSMHTYELDEVSEDMSFLEMLDVLNEELNAKGEEPIAFDSDCREGICGMCGLMINGEAHGPEVTTTCQLHMRSFTDGDTITIEPWRADAFPVIKDLCVDRGAFDRIIQQGGYISVNTGAAPDAHATPVPKDQADRAFDAATCIGCGACVAACPNGSASLFLGAKITHLGRAAAGSGRAGHPRGQHGRAARPRGLRWLHQHRRVHGRLPQGDPARRDLATQLGPARGAAPRSLTSSTRSPTLGVSGTVATPCSRTASWKRIGGVRNSWRWLPGRSRRSPIGQ